MPPRHIHTFLLGSIAAILLSACTPAPEPPSATPEATITVLSLSLPPEMDVMLPVISACEEQVPGAGLLVFGSQDPDPPAIDLALQLGEPVPDGMRAALLGYESFVVVTAAGNARAIADAAGLVDLFSAGGSAAPEIWVPLTGTAGRTALDAVMIDTPYSPEAFLAPSVEAAMAAVRAHPDALAVVPAAWLTEDLRAVYDLGSVPVLAVTDGPPTGLLRALIGCLQLNPVYAGEQPRPGD